MYSPKIAEELIPELYRIAKREGLPMTRLVSIVLNQFIKEYKNAIRSTSENRNTNYRIAG